MPTYKIQRLFARRDTPSRTIAKGLTLEQAQAHCSDPETCYKTCKSSHRKSITRRYGPWFDSYTEE